MKLAELKKLEILARAQKEQSLIEVKFLANQLHLLGKSIADFQNSARSLTAPLDAAHASANDRWLVWVNNKLRSLEAERADITIQLDVGRKKAVRTIGRLNVVETLSSRHQPKLSQSQNQRNSN